jgi:hypothetical protein
MTNRELDYFQSLIQKGWAKNAADCVRKLLSFYAENGMRIEYTHPRSEICPKCNGEGGKFTAPLPGNYWPEGTICNLCTGKGFIHAITEYSANDIIEIYTIGLEDGQIPDEVIS